MDNLNIQQFNYDVSDFFNHLDMDLRFGYLGAYIREKKYIEEKLGGTKYEFEVEINDRKNIYSSILGEMSNYLDTASEQLLKEYYSILENYGIKEWLDVEDEFAGAKHLVTLLTSLNDTSIEMVDLLSQPYINYDGFIQINNFSVSRLGRAMENYFQGKQIKLLSGIRKILICYAKHIKEDDEKFLKRITSWIDDLIIILSMVVQKTKNVPQSTEKTKIILTTSPYEFLTMGFGAGWSSCFRFSGAYATAIPKMLSSNNCLIAYIEEKNNPLNVGNYKTFYKKMRTYVAFSEDFDNFFISKIYPVYSEEFNNIIADKIQELFYNDESKFNRYTSVEQLRSDDIEEIITELDADEALYLDFCHSGSSAVGTVFVQNNQSYFYFSNSRLYCQDCNCELESDDFGDEDYGGRFLCGSCVEERFDNYEEE